MLALSLNWLIFTTVWCLTPQELILKAVEFTVNSKIESKAFNIGDMVWVDSMTLIKDGKKHLFSFEDAPQVWINYLYDEERGPGQFEWKSRTRAGLSPEGKIIHRKYCQVYNLLEPLEAMIEVDRLKSGTYSLSEDSYQGIPCYKILVRYPTDDAVISSAYRYYFAPNYFYVLFQENLGFKHRQEHITPSLFELKGEDIRDHYFAEVSLTVDKTPGRPFIYAMEAFNKGGKQVYSMNWGKVQFLPQLDAKTFQLPGNEIIPVANHQEYARQNRINFRKLYPKGWNWNYN